MDRPTKLGYSIGCSRYQTVFADSDLATLSRNEESGRKQNNR
jgi:hypothetical protein